MSFAEEDEVISLIDLLFGSSDEVDLERGPESPLVLEDPARFMRLILNCKLTDRVMFIEDVLDSMLLEDDDRLSEFESSASAVWIVSSSFSWICGGYLTPCGGVLKTCSASCSGSCSSFGTESIRSILDRFDRGCNEIDGNCSDRS